MLYRYNNDVIALKHKFNYIWIIIASRLYSFLYMGSIHRTKCIYIYRVVNLKENYGQCGQISSIIN